MRIEERLSVTMENYIALYTLTDLLTKIDEEGTVSLSNKIKLHRNTLNLDHILSRTSKYETHEQSKKLRTVLNSIDTLIMYLKEANLEIKNTTGCDTQNYCSAINSKLIYDYYSHSAIIHGLEQMDLHALVHFAKSIVFFTMGDPERNVFLVEDSEEESGNYHRFKNYKLSDYFSTSMHEYIKKDYIDGVKHLNAASKLLKRFMVYSNLLEKISSDVVRIVGITSDELETQEDNSDTKSDVGAAPAESE